MSTASPRILAAVSLVSRAGLAAVFLVAGTAKLGDPAAFAVEISRFELLPEASGLLAASLPMAEIVIGLALIGLPPDWRRAAALAAAVLLGAFTIAAASAVVRGLDIECGCFGTGSGPVTWLTLGRNALLLAMSFAVVVPIPPWPAREDSEPV